MFLSKNQAVQAFRAIDALSKRALPTLGAILKAARLKTLLTPAVTEAESISTIAQAAAEKVPDENLQMVIKNIPDFNKLLMDAMEQDSGVQDTCPRFTKADLPRLPDWSDDVAKQEKYNAAHAGLANEIAALGPLFDHEDAKAE